MRICQVIFSANRPEYLTRTLIAQRKLNLAGCEVHKILFDDFPLGRDNDLIRQLAGTFGYNEVHLHDKNLSLGATWQECWDMLKERDYDYIYHSEDDVEVLEPLLMTDLVELLQHDPTLSQVVLRRQVWYPRDIPPGPLTTDRLFKHFRYEVDQGKSWIFSPMASLYSMERVRFDYKGWFLKNYPQERYHLTNHNEGIVGKALLEAGGWVAGHLKNSAGGPLLEHIGEYTQGLKILPHEPGSASFACYHPEKRYNSRNGQLY